MKCFPQERASGREKGLRTGQGKKQNCCPPHAYNGQHLKTVLVLDLAVKDKWSDKALLCKKKD